jgi:hypothetical protein
MPIMRADLAFLSVWFFTAPASAFATGQTYINQNYEYEIKIPAGQDVATDTPPAPQHGFAINLGGQRQLSVDASYDALRLGSAEAALRDRAADAQIPASTRSVATHLAGLQASLISASVNGLTIILETCYRGDNNGSAIIYTFELDTDADHMKAIRTMLDTMLASFRTIPLTN